MTLEDAAGGAACALLIFWAALTICFLSDRQKKARGTPLVQVPPEQHTDEALPDQHPRWYLPSWEQFKARPSLFVLVPALFALHCTCMVVVLPVLLIFLWDY